MTKYAVVTPRKKDLKGIVKKLIKNGYEFFLELNDEQYDYMYAMQGDQTTIFFNSRTKKITWGGEDEIDENETELTLKEFSEMF